MWQDAIANPSMTSEEWNEVLEHALTKKDKKPRFRVLLESQLRTNLFDAIKSTQASCQPAPKK